MKDISILMNIGLAAIGYLFIMFKAGGWLTLKLAKQWDKHRKQEVKQRAVNQLYDAFELDKIKGSDELKITTKGNLVIMMYRAEGINRES
jgi:hypothetical protein